MFYGWLLAMALVPVPLEAPAESQLHTVPQKLIPSAQKVYRHLCYLVYDLFGISVFELKLKGSGAIIQISRRACFNILRDSWIRICGFLRVPSNSGYSTHL